MTLNWSGIIVPMSGGFLHFVSFLIYHVCFFLFKNVFPGLSGLLQPDGSMILLKNYLKKKNQQYNPSNLAQFLS